MPDMSEIIGDESMSHETELQKVSAETMRFMRGLYALDEIGNGVNELTFRENDEIILTIRICDTHYDFHIGDKSISVADLEGLETAKKLIMARKEPNRKPFPKEQALYGDCGQRCDLCTHYDGGTISAELRGELVERLNRVYGSNTVAESYRLCPGCHNGGLDRDFNCDQRTCAAKHGADKCVNCPNHPCGLEGAGLRPEIHTRTIYAEDVTWTILPFVYKQYGN